MHDGPSLRRLSLAELVPWALAALFLLLFVVLKSYGLQPNVGDENIYFYDAAATARGALPYRDYSFAHPPLNVLLLAPIYAIFGTSILLGKMLPALLTLGTALLVLCIARRAGREGWLEGVGRGWPSGLAALLLFVSCYDLLRCSTHFTGANLGSLLALISIERSLARRPLQAGLAVAAAALAGFYAAPAPFFAGLVLFLGRPRKLLRFLLGAAGLFVAVNLLFLAVSGRAFVEQVYLFHLAKSAHRGGNLPMWRALLRDDLVLVLSGIGGGLLVLGGVAGLHLPLRALRQGLDRMRTPLACIVGLGGHALAVLSLKRVYTYYFAPAYPLLAILGGVAFAWLVLKLHAGLLRGLRSRSARSELLVPLLALAAYLLALLSLPGGIDPVKPEWVGRTKRYHWFGRTWLGPLDSLVKGLWWSDERCLDQRYCSISRYLWHECRYSEAALELAERVRSSSTAQDLVFGDSMSAPLIALLADRRLAGDLADTNRQHYRSGRRSAARDLARVDSPRLRYVVCRGWVGICGEAAVRAWLDRSFRLDLRVRETRRRGSLYLFERNH